MPALPAICENCGTLFPSGFVVENVRNSTFAGNRSGPCPRCGGLGRVPDGVYNVVGDTIEILQRPGRSSADLERLAALLRSAAARSASIDEIRDSVARELPELQSIADVLPKSRSELYAFLSLIIAAIALILSVGKEDGAKQVINLEQVINIVSEHPNGGNGSASSHTVEAGAVKGKASVGRNDPCPCGSGKKYKKCHLLAP